MDNNLTHQPIGAPQASVHVLRIIMWGALGGRLWDLLVWLLGWLRAFSGTWSAKYTRDYNADGDLTHLLYSAYVDIRMAVEISGYISNKYALERVSCTKSAAQPLTVMRLLTFLQSW